MMSPNKTHQWLLIVEPPAQAAFDPLLDANKRGVFRHLVQLLRADDPYEFAFVQMLKGEEFARVRKFRVGDYRVFSMLIQNQ